MHFLAHMYLSQSSSGMMTGNFIGEIKTITDLSQYDKEVRNGIRLHKMIDEFTNNDPVVMRSRRRLNPKYSKYSDIIIDVFYDHFLSLKWNNYSKIPLEEFALNSYRTLLDYQAILPYKAKLQLPHMIKGNWLAGYKTISGIQKSINEMNTIARNKAPIISGLEDLIIKYGDFKQDFEEFFPKLINSVEVRSTNADLRILEKNYL